MLVFLGLSSSVANALRLEGRFCTRLTAKFCETFDKAFDCLNVAKPDWTVKEALRPYTNNNNQRFEVRGSMLVLTRFLIQLFFGMVNTARTRLMMISPWIF